MLRFGKTIGSESQTPIVKRGIPIWAKALALVFLVYFVWTTYNAYGPSNFLWLSNIGLFGTVLALCIDSRLLASTMLVFTVGQGVHGFTLEPSIGEYLLSNENIRIPQKGKVYSVNEFSRRHKHPLKCIMEKE